MNRNNFSVFITKKLLPLGATLLFLGVLSLPCQVKAQLVTNTHLNSTTITDFGSDAGMKFWSVDGQNQLVKQWFWYRVGAGVAQPINNISAANVTFAGGEVIATYQNALFSLQIKYLLTGGTFGSGTADIQETIVVTNLSGGILDFHFYQYSDFDLLGTGGDSVVVDNNFAFQTKGPTQIAEAVNQPTANHYEAGLHPNTLNSLNTVAGLILNDAPMAGPGNVTWALQWDRQIGDGLDFEIFKDKLLSVAPIPEPSSMVILAIGLGLSAWKCLPRRRQNS